MARAHRWCVAQRGAAWPRSVGVITRQRGEVATSAFATAAIATAAVAAITTAAIATAAAAAQPAAAFSTTAVSPSTLFRRKSGRS